jgi:hypothetical protein
VANATVKTVEKIVTSTEVDGVVLELTHDEARFLKALLGHTICGLGTARKLSANIYNALKDAGYSMDRSLGHHLFRDQRLEVLADMPGEEP